MLTAHAAGAVSVAALLFVAGADLSAQTIVGTGFPAGTQSFSPYSPLALSGDGAVVYGRASNGHGFRWSAATGFLDMGLPAGQTSVNPGGVSSDGRSLAGYTYGVNNFRAFRWTDGVYQDLGLLSGGTWSQGKAISGNGLVVVGQGNNGTSIYRAFRWSGGVMTALPRVTGSISDSVAWGTNADGSVVVGQDFVGNPGAGYRGFRWTTGGTMTLNPLSGQVSSRALCVSADGAVVAGVSNPTSINPPTTPVVWDSAGNVRSLGLGEGMTEAQPTCISADGSVIGLICWPGGPAAGMWSAATGTVMLSAYLPTVGFDLTNWSLTRTYGISADGLTITGEGSYLDEFGVYVSQAWIVTLPCLAAPTIAVQPPATSVCPAGGESATITVVGGGSGINAYRWQWQPDGAGGVWVDLAEGVNTAGGVAALLASNKDTATLTVAPMAGNGETARPLRCVVGNPCGSVTSNPALLTVIHRCGAADIGSQGGVSSSCGDGRLDNNDFIVFIDRFFAGDASADVGQQGGVPGADGLYDNNDFIVYIDMFFNAGGTAGC